MKTVCALVADVFYGRELIIAACFLAMTLAEEMKPVEIPATPQGEHSLRCDFLRSRETISYKFASLLKPYWQRRKKVRGLLTHTALYSLIDFYYFVNSTLTFYYYRYWTLWRGCNPSWWGPQGSCTETAMVSPTLPRLCPATTARASAKAGNELLWETGNISPSKGPCWRRALCLVTQSHLRCLCMARCFAVQLYPHCYKRLFTYSD